MGPLRVLCRTSAECFPREAAALGRLVWQALFASEEIEKDELLRDSDARRGICRHG
jgi:hypothetical protein